jgi:acyl-CoA synthetase (AMP-forming)/AMP-acid ligase II
MLAENPITYFEDLFHGHHDGPCVVSGTTFWTYGDFLREISEDRRNLQSSGIGAGDVVIVAGNSVLRHLSLFFALSALDAIIVPLVGREDEICECGDVANATHVLSISDNESWTIDRTSRSVTNPLLKRQFERREAGLVMFTSGSTGKKKALLYSVPKVLRRFQVRRNSYRSLMFSSIDHFGGWNTIFYILSNGGMIVFPSSQRPDEACRLIQEHRIELLPTTPSFINLLLLSRAPDAYDLSSLRMITYGSELMPDTTLQNLRCRFPNVILRQTYGLSELGQIKVMARDPGSLAVKVVGEGFETKVIDGTLWVRSDYAMEGYLNSNAGFTKDGWFDTGDMVRMEGEFITFLGRKSELINVAGLKVYPGEVESFLLAQPGVSEALVSGEPNVLVGNTVVAQVVASTDEPERVFIQRLRAECKKRLPRYMVPTRIHVVKQLYYSRQHKKNRAFSSNGR